MDLGVNITGELEGLKKNLDAYKVKIILHMCHFRCTCIIFGSKSEWITTRLCSWQNGAYLFCTCIACDKIWSRCNWIRCCPTRITEKNLDAHKVNNLVAYKIKGTWMHARSREYGCMQDQGNLGAHKVKGGRIREQLIPRKPCFDLNDESLVLHF